VDSDSEDRPGRGQNVAGRPVVGIVTEQLPSSLYRVKLDAGSLVTAHIADRIDRNFVRVLIGDRVRVELSRADVTRGRIVEKLE
jgi:translation initiation factor IF-1